LYLLYELMMIMMMMMKIIIIIINNHLSIPQYRQRGRPDAVELTVIGYTSIVNVKGQILIPYRTEIAI